VVRRARPSLISLSAALAHPDAMPVIKSAIQGLAHDKTLVPTARRGWPLLCPSHRNSKQVMDRGSGWRES